MWHLMPYLFHVSIPCPNPCECTSIKCMWYNIKWSNGCDVRFEARNNAKKAFFAIRALKIWWRKNERHKTQRLNFDERSHLFSVYERWSQSHHCFQSVCCNHISQSPRLFLFPIPHTYLSFLVKLIFHLLTSFFYLIFYF